MKVSDVITKVKRIEVILNSIDDGHANLLINGAMNQVIDVPTVLEDIYTFLDEYKDELLNKVVK